MKNSNRRKFSSDFKAKVVLEALKERITIEEIARRYELHPNQVSLWKKEFLAKVATVFNSEAVKESEKQQEQQLEKLYAQIGQLKVENDFLKKKLQ